MLKTRMIFLWIAVGFLSCCFCATFAFARGGGKGHGSSSLHTWNQGEKKGWETGDPPSFQKKGEGMNPSGLSDVRWKPKNGMRKLKNYKKKNKKKPKKESVTRKGIKKTSPRKNKKGLGSTFDQWLLKIINLVAGKEEWNMVWISRNPHVM